MITRDQDPMGQAIYQYYKNKDRSPVLVDTNITQGEELPIEHLFRSYKDMPLLEQKALALVKGKTLDIGAGAGAHSLYLQRNGVDVTAMDISELSCEVMQLRGVENVVCADVWHLKEEKYDTLLFMMNGIGLVKSLEGLTKFLEHIKKYMADGGQIIMDSSDLKYMYEDDEGGYWIDLNSSYYGELEYHLSYKEYSAKPFPWLFVDYNKLKEKALNSGFDIELIYEDDHHHYLARLILKS